MVAADQLHAVGVAQFEAGEEGDGLYGEEAPVDVVAWTVEERKLSYGRKREGGGKMGDVPRKR